jgi:hypothetical protein
MTDDFRLALLKLCIQWQDENVYGNKTKFWYKMSVLLAQECGVLLKDPQSTIDDMVAARRIVVATQKTESGSVQQETELTQTLDLWIEIEDEKNRQKDEAKSLQLLRRKKLKTQRTAALICLSLEAKRKRGGFRRWMMRARGGRRTQSMKLTGMRGIRKERL